MAKKWCIMWTMAASDIFPWHSMERQDTKNFIFCKFDGLIYKLLLINTTAFSFCLTGLFSSNHSRLLRFGQIPKGLQTAGGRFFTSWMPFLSPNLQCQSTEGTVTLCLLIDKSQVTVVTTYSGMFPVQCHVKSNVWILLFSFKRMFRIQHALCHMWPMHSTQLRLSFIVLSLSAQLAYILWNAADSVMLYNSETFPNFCIMVQNSACCGKLWAKVITAKTDTTRSLFELPFLSTHRTQLIHLLRIEPFYNAVDMEAVWTLAPHYNSATVLHHSLML